MPDRYKPASTVDSRAQLGEPLTKTELYIMRRLAAGAYDAEITRELSMSGRNFRRHMLAAQRKLGARTRPHAVALAAEQAARLAGRREGAPMAGGLTRMSAADIEAARHLAASFPAISDEGELRARAARLASAVRRMAAELKQAEAERDAFKAEVERLTEERDAARLVSEGRTMEQYDQQAAIERVRALHTQGVMPDMCKECNHVPAADCPTLRALDTPASPKGAPDDR